MIESSAIISKGFTGDMGPVGAIGPTGPTGATAINCGTLAKGNTASYIKSVNINPTDLLITYSDNSSTTINSDVFAGNRLYDATGVTVWKTDSTNGVVSLLVGVSFDGTLGSGSTANFIFKPISSVSGNITLTHGVTFVNINSTSSIYSSGVSADKLIYFNSTTSLAGITTDMSFTGGVLHFNNIGSVIPFTTRLLSNTLIKNIESTVRGSSGSYLNVAEGGLFYINTPNGIMGFTGFSGASGSTGEIQSLTLVIENDSIWNFPENVWFRPGEASLSCGENILNLTTQDNGKIWKANFFGKGYGVTPYNCLPSQILGRCSTTDTCESYVTKEYCDNTPLGTFCPLKMCEDLSGAAGACCINGVCQIGYSKIICEKHGGRFFAGKRCDEFFCWDPCYDQPSCCCVAEEDAPRQRYTKTECDLVSGTFFETCPDTCNIGSGLVGACCLGSECLTKTFSECNELGGVFMGLNENCNEICCACVNAETTTCRVGANREADQEQGWCLRTYDILLHGAPIFKELSLDTITLKLNFNTYTYPDRFMIIQSKSLVSGFTNTLRMDPGSLYGSCTANTKEEWFDIVDKREHPYFGEQDLTLPPETIKYDSGCNTLTDEEVIIKITENDVEMYDTTDSWYKKIRLFVLGNCDSSNSPPNERTSFKMDINCNGGTTPPPVPSQYFPITKAIQIFGDSLSQSVTIDVIDTASNFNKIGIVVPNPTATVVKSKNIPSVPPVPVIVIPLIVVPSDSLNPLNPLNPVTVVQSVPPNPVTVVPSVPLNPVTVVQSVPPNPVTVVPPMAVPPTYGAY